MRFCRHFLQGGAPSPCRQFISQLGGRCGYPDLHGLLLFYDLQFTENTDFENTAHYILI